MGAALALLALALVLTTNAATVAWAVPALLVTIAYPYAKRLVSMPQAVLGWRSALVFQWPSAVQAGPTMELWSGSAWPGWGEGVVSLAQHSRSGLVAVAGQPVLVLAYDTEYAMVDRDDDLKIGMKTSAITLGRWDVAAIMGFLCFLRAVLAACKWLVSRTFSVFVLATVLGGPGGVALIHRRERDACFQASGPTTGRVYAVCRCRAGTGRAGLAELIIAERTTACRAGAGMLVSLL